MRTARLKEDGRAYYHCMTRIVDRQFLFNGKEKERLCKLMRSMEIFTGVHILTHSFLDNHYHLLMEVPERVDIPDDEFKRRLLAVYTEDHVSTVMGIIRDYRQAKEDALADKEKAKYTYRMYDVSEFMKTFKQKYTQSYNRRHGRRGTLWEERFKSLLVQGSRHALLAIAAYIDLNALRAGIVNDPKDYRYCGYGEAIAGKKAARAGLVRILESEGVSGGWKEISSVYRKQLYIAGEAKGIGENGKALKVGFAPEKVEQVLKDNGALPLTDLLRCRVRYFSDGVAIGSRDYVDGVFEKYRDQFGKERKTGARTMKGGGWGDLCTIRDLRLSTISVPT
jgi:putative transposase